LVPDEWLPKRGKAVRFRYERVTVCHLPLRVDDESGLSLQQSLVVSPRESGELLERRRRHAQQVHHSRDFHPCPAARSVGRKIGDFMKMSSCGLIGGVCAMGISFSALAELVNSYAIGSGTKSATLQFDFENGNAYTVSVRWNGALNGFQGLQMMAAHAPGGALQYQSFSFGKFVTGIGVGADFTYGEGDLWPVENYWHYWSRVSASTAWQMAEVGADARMLVEGSFDAWVFGSGDAPQAVPAPSALLLVSVACARRRRMC